MKKSLAAFVLLGFVVMVSFSTAPVKAEDRSVQNKFSFKQWLFKYIPTQYPDAKMIDHTYWLQGYITDVLVVNWTEWTDADSTLKAMEAHNLTPGKAMFIEQKGPKKDWADHPAVTYYEGSGYYIAGYDPATMGHWDGKGLSVIQFDGDSKELAQTIALGWARATSFESWLYLYLPIQYPNARMAIHFNKWKQAHITDHIVASWEQWNAKDLNLKGIEKESLAQGKAFFIEQKGPKKDWANHPAVTYYEDAGYYCFGYDQATMRDWVIEGLTVIQFDGDSKALAETIAKAWANSLTVSDVANPTSASKVTSNAVSAEAPKAVFAVNCGGPAFTSYDGTVYAADTGFTGGETFSSEGSIAKTTDQTLYQSERYGDSKYAVTVPNGRYLVALHFAETFHGSAGSRRFDVRMEGAKTISGLDIFAKAGANTAYMTQSYVTVTDGQLNIEFVTQVENAKINAIKVSLAESDAAFIASPPKARPAKGMSTSLKVAAPKIGLSNLKPRVVVLTDISTWETDDHESLIRYLAHADMFETEALIISTGYSIKTLTKSPEKEFIDIARGVIDAYEKDLPNLMKLSNQVGHKHDDARQEIGYWPSPGYLRDRLMFGSLNRGVKFIGEDNDSPGSDLIIKLADEKDPRPVWITVWGGGNTVAQSIYRVKKDRSPEQFKAFLNKIRIYTITDQDRHYQGEGLDVSAHGWMREQAGSDLMFIWDESAWKLHNSIGKSNWNEYATHIQGHGHMGSQYPKYMFGVEGDTPAFLYLMPTGLNNPEDPAQCSWGGNFIQNKENNFLSPMPSCGDNFKRFYPAAFNNFAARMDWAKNGVGNRNPVIDLDGDKGISIVRKTPKPGATVTLDASGTVDPDGDNLSFNWWVQADAGSYTGTIDIANSNTNQATINVPADATGKSFHVICEVIDDGTHNLSDYRRIIFESTDKKTSSTRVKVSTEKLDGINTFKVETAMGTFHWECDPGKSGWMSAFDNNGKDWITAGPKQRGVGVNSHFRGLPNSGADDWGHPSRNWNHKKANVTSEIVGPTEGEKVVIESGGNTITARWHCFNTHIAMEVVELKSGKYHFLWEGTPGNTIHSEEGIITADGKRRKIKEGWFAETPDWPAGDHGEWLIITDPHKKCNMWMAQTPATNDKGELWYQKGNMDLVSFGRPDNKPTFTDTERVFAWGFIPYAWDFDTAKAHIETILENPLEKKKVTFQKPRMIITTDLGADPDDEQSMVRYLVCSNEFETEGLIVSTGCWKKNQSSTVMLDKLVNAYDEVYDNLKCHAEEYPTPEYLKSISVMGQRGYGMGDVGDGKDSPGSDMIIAAVDKNDPRPVWVGGWGGVNNVAQAIWKVQQTRSEAELKTFISKLRVFDILGQDDAGAWLAKNYPDLFYIRATGVYGWQPPKNGSYQKEDIQSHGPLGAAYPDTKWATEGDTPAYMHVYPNGLNDPDQIDQGSWGGRFSFKKQKNIRSMSEVHKIQKDGESQFDPYYMYGNTPEKAAAIKRWSKGYDNDFAARMDWTLTNDYSAVNHHPIAVVNGDTTRQVLQVSAAAGSSVVLSAAGSSDPDGDSLIYSWSFYKDPSSYKGSVDIQNSTAASAMVAIPADAKGKNIHMILELNDSGSPSLYAYRRVIINVK